MKFSSLLNTEHIILNLRHQERNEVIEEILCLIEEQKQLQGLSKSRALEMLSVREDQSSTGIGSGVAIPHAFCETLDEVVCVFARSSQGVDFEAIDHAPVHFVVLFLVPQKDYCRHLQTLSAIAKIFKSCEMRSQLKQAETREEIFKILENTTEIVP